MSARAKIPHKWLVTLVLAALVCVPGLGWAETMKVALGNQSLYGDPNFSATPIAPVPQGAEVTVVSKNQDWYKVDYKGNSGWMHRSAFAEAEAPKTGGGIGGMLFGGGVKQTKSDEVALAGKGFTPEVEAGYRQQHPEAKFAEVDQIEGFTVDDAKLQAFIKEGGLRP